MENLVKNQHYVQKKGIINQWCDENNMVGVIKKLPDLQFVKEKRKSAKSLFFHPFYYEVLDDPDILEKKVSFKTQQGAKLCVNDGERYCSNIENLSIDVLKRIIGDCKGENNVLANSDMIYISKEDWRKLCQYIALQIIRTPRGREKLLGEKGDKGAVIDLFIKNVTYLIELGVYSVEQFLGEKQSREKPVIIYEKLYEILLCANLEINYIEEHSTAQYILGDNPYIILGDSEIKEIYVPLTPKLVMKIFWTSEDRKEFIKKTKADEISINFVNAMEYLDAREKVVFSESVGCYQDLKSQLNEGIDIWKDYYKKNIWQISNVENYDE